MPSDARPTIVLVRGAFADASGWAEVITSLTGAGRSRGGALRYGIPGGYAR